MILLDTTVLVYAVGTEHPLRQPARDLLRARRNGRHVATSIEVIQEFTHVRARRRSRQDTVILARHYARALSLLATTPDDLELGLELFHRHSALGAFDSVLAAMGVNHRVEALVSADRAFQGIPALRWIDLATRDLDALLHE